MKYLVHFLMKIIECDNSKIVEVKRMQRKVIETDVTVKFFDRQMIIVTLQTKYPVT